MALLVVGGSLYGLYRVARPPPERPGIGVSSATVDAIYERLTVELGRTPSKAELEAALGEWVDREILVREAWRRGLDRADPIVRRRMVQKMRFALEDAQLVEDPGDAVLQARMDAQPERYRRPPRRGFTHVFVAGHDAQAQARAHALARALRDGADPTGQGDAFAHGPRQPPASRAELAGRYGEAFAQAVEAAERDAWVVVASTFGWHVLRVDVERAGALPALAEIRPRVLADWRVDARADRYAQGMEDLRARYAVEVEP